MPREKIHLIQNHLMFIVSNRSDSKCKPYGDMVIKILIKSLMSVSAAIGEFGIFEKYEVKFSYSSRRSKIQLNQSIQSCQLLNDL